MTVYRPRDTTNIHEWNKVMKAWVDFYVKDPEVNKIMSDHIKDIQNLVEDLRRTDGNKFVSGQSFQILSDGFRKRIFGKTDALVISFFRESYIKYVFTHAGVY